MAFEREQLRKVEIMRSPWLAGTVQMFGLRVYGLPACDCSGVLFHLLYPLSMPLTCPACQFLQALLLVGIQLFPVVSRIFLRLHQMLWNPGCVSLYMGRIRHCYVPTQQSLFYTLPNLLQ